ncbi:MAG: M16 family metallopeptidase, partial [Terriglobales bacterium]
MRNFQQIAVVLLFVSALWAQQSGRPPLPTDLPKAGVLKAPSSPGIEQHKLKNGVEVWLVQRPELPKVAFKLVVRGGDSLDPADAPGLAKVTARAITQGTASRSSRQIAEAAQGAGGDLASFATVDWTEVSLDALSEHAGDAISLLADIAQNANFPDSEVALVKSNMQDELRASEARPRFLAQRAWYGVTYGDHPYHIVAASMKTLQSATPKALQALYQTEFRPDQALLIAVGSFDRSAVLADIEKAFGSWKAPATTSPQVKAPTTKADHKVYYIERPGSVQTTMLIGTVSLNASDPDEPRLRLANTIYGGSFGSRLTRNIREDKGYTYSPFSYVPTTRLSGACLTSEDVRNEVTGASLKETFYELKRISTEPPSEDEMASAKRYLIGNTALDLQSRTQVGELLGKYWVMGEPATHLDQEMSDIQKTTPADAAQIAAKYLSPERMTIIAVGEKQVIQDQLKPFG